MGTNKESDEIPKDEAGSGFPEDISTKDKGLNRGDQINIKLFGGSFINKAKLKGDSEGRNILETYNKILEPEVKVKFIIDILKTWKKVVDISDDLPSVVYKMAFSELLDVLSLPDLPQTILRDTRILTAKLQDKMDSKSKEK